jgi:IPT/TIG domain-containing protein
VYNYDAVGDLLSISNYSGSTVLHYRVHAGQRPVGTTVTIYGTGFSSTASQNTVQFNGTTAIVTPATAN